MRILAFTLALSACGVPYKYQAFDLPPGHRDVIWVFKDGQLYRCTGVAGRAPCVAATYVERASITHADEQGVVVAPPAAPPPTAPASRDLRPLQ